MSNNEIVVVGYRGVVGSATYELLHRLGHQVSGADVGDPIKAGAFGYVVCTPEEAVPDVIARIKEFYHQLPYHHLVVVRSTTPIGTIDRLMAEHNMHICHWPEHLREATSLWDAYFPQFVSFGQCCREHGDMLHDLLESMAVPVLRSDIRTSEASKLAINNFKAVMVSYWNEFHDLGKKMGFNSHLAARIATNDPVVPCYGTVLGGAFGGKCLPKDLDQTIAIYDEQALDCDLLKAVRIVNKGVKEKHGESTVRTG